jgi:hypothetical protein
MASRRKKVLNRGGLSALEVFVALTLLSSGLTFCATLLVRHHRLNAEQRHYRVALDELSNQLERLGALPAGDVAAAVADMRPSDFAAERLPGARLRGELASADRGRQLTVWITWDERPKGAVPLALTAWVGPREGASP